MFEKGKKDYLDYFHNKYDYVDYKDLEMTYEIAKERLLNTLFPFNDDIEEVPSRYKMKIVEVMEEIIATIHNLDEPYKEVFWLRFYGEMSYKEIGSIFGKSEVWGRVTYLRTKEMILRRIKDGDMD